MHRNFGEHISNDGYARQIYRARPAEATLQKFRHGEHIGAQIKRNENPTQYQKDQASQPLEMADRQSRGGSRSRQSNEMFSRNIGSKQRRPKRQATRQAASKGGIDRNDFLEL